MTDCIDTAAERAKLAALEGHTPGPWTLVSLSGYGSPFSIRMAMPPGSRHPTHYGVQSVGTRSDAHLIAAAPDLKGTLAAALDEIDRLREALTRIADYRAVAHAYDNDTEAPQ